MKTQSYTATSIDVYIIVHSQVKMNFLMSPMLVVVYALVGRVDIDLINDPVGYNPNGEAVYLKDIWPSREEINQTIGYSTYLPTGETMTVYETAMKYAEDQTPLIVLAGKEYGSGSQARPSK